MADEPISALGNKTPLQFAKTPYMDKLTEQGVTGLLKTIPEGFYPGSEVANMTVLGYDLPSVYEGRGVLEAAGMGVDLKPRDVAMRCNLVYIENDTLKDHTSDHITTEEADLLIETLNDKLGSERISFHTGKSYRHLLVVNDADKHLDCTPPHDILFRQYKPYLVKADVKDAQESAYLLNDLILKSQGILRTHPVNIERIKNGKYPANSIWPWSPGSRPAMKTMREMYGIKKGSVISAVDLIRGIGIYAGLNVIRVEGATGMYDTNYEGKVAAALTALRDDDFVFLHVEASDDAGHQGDVRLKIQTIEDLDKRIVGPLYEELKTWDEPVAIAVLPDHPTPCITRSHTNKPVPFLIYKPGMIPDEVKVYDEFSTKHGRLGILEKNQFIKELLK